MNSPRGFSYAAVTVALWLGTGAAGCMTPRKDVTGTGDDHYDETSSPDHPKPVVKDASQCGAAGKGDVVLLDGRTGQPVACALVTLFREASDCNDGECPAESIFQGHSNLQGMILVSQSIAQARVYAVGEGYAQSYRQPGPTSPQRLTEIEMIPEEGFLLKILDGDGNYLPGVEVTFKQGEEVLAQLRTNDLANVFFGTRSPFSGDPVVITVEGYKPVTVASSTDLGADGHTVVVKK